MLLNKVTISHNKYIRFLTRLISILLILLALDIIFGYILRHYYFKQESGLLYRTTYAIDSTNADILVFGSSRANHHYVPEIFEEDLKMRYYNTGRDGNSILYNYAVLKAVLLRYTPKIIILDLRPYDCYYNKISYERLSSLLPYYSSHLEIRDIVNLRSPYERIKHFSKIYPFNSSLLTICIGNFYNNKKRKFDNDGYIPLMGTTKENELIPVPIPRGKIDYNILNAIDSMSCLCYQKGIKLFLCFSPIYYQIEETKLDTLIYSIAKKYNFKYLNFSNIPEFTSQPSLFRDRSHLNNKGAMKYSFMVIDSISPIRK